MLGPDEFAAMRPGTFFCNVARGSMVDEPAMLAALASGTLTAAALDVVANEPLPADSALWDAEGIVLSPHSSTTQDGYFEAGAELFWTNATRLAAGDDPVNAVDTTRW
jgi:phosphoglycerate dehydrogenase-like enzyme